MQDERVPGPVFRLTLYVYASACICLDKGDPD